MLCSVVMQIRLIAPPRRKAGKTTRGVIGGGGDYMILAGLFWGPRKLPQRVNVLVMGSDFRVLEALDHNRGPVITITNAHLLQPLPRTDRETGEITYVHRLLCERGSSIVVTSRGGALLGTHLSGSEKCDQNRVDRDEAFDPLKLMEGILVDDNTDGAAGAEVSHISDPRPVDPRYPQRVRFQT